MCAKLFVHMQFSVETKSNIVLNFHANLISHIHSLTVYCCSVEHRKNYGNEMFDVPSNVRKLSDVNIY